MNHKKRSSSYNRVPKIKVKGISIRGLEGKWEMWMQGTTYTQPQHQEEVGWLVLCSAAFTPRESPQYSFYRRLSGPQDQSGHEEVKKTSPPPIPRIEPRPSSPQSSTSLLELPDTHNREHRSGLSKLRPAGLFWLANTFSVACLSRMICYFSDLASSHQNKLFSGIQI